MLAADSSRDFEYEIFVREADALAMSFRVKDVRSKCLEPAIAAFSTNVVRTANFVTMPALASGFVITEDDESGDSLTAGIQYIESMAASGPMQQSLDAML